MVSWTQVGDTTDLVPFLTHVYFLGLKAGRPRSKWCISWLAEGHLLTDLT